MKQIQQKDIASIRLTQDEINTVKKAVYSIDPYAEVYLFGSRTDALKRGGDIDLLVISQQMTAQDIRKVRWAFYETFGEQKMDIVLDDGTLETPFVKMILPQALAL